MSNSVFSVEPYPLLWPEHMERTPEWERQYGTFRLDFSVARKHLCSEVEKLGGKHLVISSNQPVRRDGMPLAVKVAVPDPGVAVYFARDGEAHCFACDHYRSVLANLRAIGKTIEAIRGIERWGGKQLMDRTMGAFLALPAETAASGAWWEVLRVSPQADRDTIEAVYRAQAKRLHPDRGGDEVAFLALQRAYGDAIAAVGG